MKFGAVTADLLSDIDLSLPKEPFINTLILSGKRVANPKVYMGAATWGDTSWVGKVYQPKTPATKYRQFYPQHFNAIELNATHYNIYTPEIIRQWAEPAKQKDFKFCPKFPQQISHYSNFKNADDLTTAFLEGVLAFEENLGPIFLQLGEQFSPLQKEALFSFLASLPKDLTFFLEVRHPAWFSDKEQEELFTRLRELQIGAVITDAPGRRDVAHMNLTLPKLFLRFVCNAVHSTSFSRTDAWIERIQHWLDNGLEEAYIFLHPGNDAAVPELANYWTQQVNTYCGLHLPAPLIQQTGLLF